MTALLIVLAIFCLMCACDYVDEHNEGERPVVRLVWLVMALLFWGIWYYFY